MELMEIYNQIKNPLDNPQLLERIIKAYANSSSEDGFYAELVRATDKQYYDLYDPDAKEELLNILFKKWKDNILSINESEFIKLKNAGILDDDFLLVKQFVKKLPPQLSAQDIDRLGFQENEKIRNAIEHYIWQSNADWFHIKSRRLNIRKEPNINVEHRLYLNAESIYVHRLASIFITKCEENNLPYYFKFATDKREDTFVIYSDTEHLTKYIDVLQEIKKEYPRLFEVGIKSPPILSGKITDWLGYGSEPTQLAGSEPHSFNSVRASIIRPVIDREIKSWLNKNLNIYVSNNKIPLAQYFALQATENFIKNLSDNYKTREKIEKDSAQKKGVPYDANSVSQYLGYSKKDLESPTFKQQLFKIINNNSIIYLQNFLNNAMPPKNFKITFANGKTEEFRYMDYFATVRKIAVDIAMKDSMFVLGVKNGIKNEISKTRNKYFVDSEKICFDVNAIKRIQQVSKTQQAQAIKEKAKVESILK